jgi:DNA-binding NarL/FixJ family response regulator
MLSRRLDPAVKLMTESANSNIRVLLIDELCLFRATLGRYLSAEPGFEVAGECGTVAEALKVLGSATECPIDVVLLDFQLGSESAEALISSARDAGYRGAFLVVTGSVEAQRSAVTLRLGSSGVFLKTEPPSRLIQAIRQVAGGDVWIDRKVVDVLVDQTIERIPHSTLPVSGEPLSDREQKVLLGVLDGLPNRKIGANLGISESSVKNVIQHLFARTRVRTRSQLVRIALEATVCTVQQIAHPDPPEDGSCGVRGQPFIFDRIGLHRCMGDAGFKADSDSAPARLGRVDYAIGRRSS